MVEVYLIGTNHEDEAGPKKLELALQEVNPEIILIEGDSSSVLVNKRHAVFLKDELVKRRLDPESREEVLAYHQSIGYETVVCQKYASQKGIDLEFFGDHSSIGKNDRESRAIARDSVRWLLRNSIEGFRQTVTEKRKDARMFWEHLKRIEGTLEEQQFANEVISKQAEIYNCIHRATLMDSVLRSKISANFQKRIVSVTGANHILDDQKNRNLYGKIRDLNPQRRFLY